MLNTSPTISELATALVACSPELKNIPRDSTASIQTRSGGSYEYKYVSLPVMLETYKPILKKHKLCVFQGNTLTSDGVIINTRIIHESGEWIESELYLAISAESRMNDAQRVGSAITYGRRYTLAEALGVASEDDTDTVENDDHTYYKAPATAPDRPSKPATQAQMALIQKLQTNGKIDKEKTFKNLTSQQASDIIKEATVSK